MCGSTRPAAATPAAVVPKVEPLKKDRNNNIRGRGGRAGLLTGQGQQQANAEKKSLLGG